MYYLWGSFTHFPRFWYNYVDQGLFTWFPNDFRSRKSSFRRRIVIFICLIYSGMIHEMDHMIIKRIVLLNLVSRNEHWTLWDLESLARNHDYNDDQGSDEKMSAFALLSLKVNPFVTGLGQDQKLIDEHSYPIHFWLNRIRLWNDSFLKNGAWQFYLNIKTEKCWLFPFRWQIPVWHGAHSWSRRGDPESVNGDTPFRGQETRFVKF